MFISLFHYHFGQNSKLAFLCILVHWVKASTAVHVQTTNSNLESLFLLISGPFDQVLHLHFPHFSNWQIVPLVSISKDMLTFEVQTTNSNLVGHLLSVPRPIWAAYTLQHSLTSQLAKMQNTSPSINKLTIWISSTKQTLIRDSSAQLQP